MFKNINNSIYEIFVNLFQEKNKNSIIEPLICLVRLAILEFKPHGTKISIFNNRISYNDPNMLQGALRWSNGDTRDDLHNIFLPITKFNEWYDIDNDDVKNILTFSIRGLEKLKSSYNKNSTINHSIEYYISYLYKTLQGELGDRSTEKITRSSKQTRIDETNTIFNKLKGIWNQREISIINNLLIELDSRRSTTTSETEINTIIDTIETLIISKENKVFDLIVKTSTLLE